MSGALRLRVPPPIFRKLRVFAIDPGMTARFETAVLNEMTLAIPWEPLEAGPVGEYVAVVDESRAGKLLNEPVVLDRHEILAQDGLAPSDGNPQFRQQMMYAVAMRTIRNFERALGRSLHWRALPVSRAKAAPLTYQRRLGLYPHYEEIQNSWYEPSAGAVRFGYFESSPDSPFPGTTVFTCLSQDAIARPRRASAVRRHADRFRWQTPRRSGDW